MNNVALVGRLGQEPELRETKTGKKVLKFSLGVKKNHNKKLTNWIRCVAWEQAGELIAQYVKKGEELGITGELTEETWEDKETKKKMTAHTVLVDGITFIGGAGEKTVGTYESERKKESSRPAASKDADLDAIFASNEEIPF